MRTLYFVIDTELPASGGTVEDQAVAGPYVQAGNAKAGFAQGHLGYRRNVRGWFNSQDRYKVVEVPLDWVRGR